MYGNPYYTQQAYQQDLINMRDRLDKQIQQAQMPMQPQQTPITQNFQLAPNQNQNGIKYVNSIEDVKKELVFNDTLFVNKEYTLLWLKNALGEVKTYKLEEVIEIDEKDQKINELMAKIERLESQVNKNEPATNSNEYANGTITSTKSSSISKSKSSDK